MSNLGWVSGPTGDQLLGSPAIKWGYEPRSRVVVAAAGGDYTSLSAVFADYPSGNVEIVIKGTVVVPATLVLSGVKNVVLRGQGRGSSILNCTQGLLSAGNSSDQWQISDLTIACTAATNTNDGVAADYPRRWSISRCTFSGFGGSTIWYRGGLHSEIKFNNIIAKDSANANGLAGIQISKSSTDVVPTTIRTEGNYIQSGKQYGMLVAALSLGLHLNDAAELCDVGFRFETSDGAIVALYTEQCTTAEIQLHDSIMTVLGRLRTEPVVTWANHAAVDRRFARVARNWISPGKAIVYGGSTGASDPTAAPSIRWGTGSPEGTQAGVVSSVWYRTDGGTATTMYVKESGTGSTGWVAK